MGEPSPVAKLFRGFCEDAGRTCSPDPAVRYASALDLACQRIAELEGPASSFAELREHLLETLNTTLNTADEIADAVDVAIRVRDQRIAELEAERRWIPVEERLPPADVEVLLWFRDADTRLTTPSHEALGYWIDIGEDYPMWVAPYPWDTQKPVFWMPKPKPPEATDAE